MVEQPHNPITSDIPPPTREHTPAYIAWRKEIDETDAKIKEYEKNIVTLEKELGVIDWVYPVDEETPFNASDLAHTILARNEYNIITDRISEVIYLFDTHTGIYHKDGEQFLQVILNNVLGKESTPQRVKQTIELIKYNTFATITPSSKIAVQNGLLDIKTLELTPFNQFEFVTNKLNAEFKKDAKSEPFENFVNQDCPDDKDLLQEWSGYLLIKGYPFHAIMWLYGPTGRNGKGAWARTMQGILGPENYSNVSIDNFDGKHRFAVFNLHDSLFNICSEPRTDRPLSIEMLQMLSGEDSIDAERKNIQKPFKMLNPAKLTVMGNKFPKVDMPTDAFWDRLKLCKFPNRFVGNDQIQQIEKTWLSDPEQRSGILNWMLTGAKRLLDNHGFSMTKTQEETIIQFKRASDTIGAFIAECIEYQQKEYVAKIALSEHYKAYCEFIGVTPENPRTFSDRIRNTPRIKDANPYLQGKKTKAWSGITLKTAWWTTEEPQKTLEKQDKIELIEPKEPLLHPTNIEKSDNFGSINLSETVLMVPTVPNDDEVHYEQLVCCQCGKAINDNDWVRDSFTENKPCHKKCYENQQAMLREFSDDNPRGEGS